MDTSSHHFSRLVTADRLSDIVGRKRLKASLHGVGMWLTAASETTGASGKLHRNAVYHQDGRVTWLYPNSNTGELISAMLDLGFVLEDTSWTDAASAYADALLDDSVHGLYRGERLEAHGLAWYWTDAGTYTGGYSMRMPAHFFRLYEATGNQRYLDACDWIGRTMLDRQLESGLVTAAWNPQDGWMPEPRMGSRYMYPLATFATLWKVTGDAKYLSAYERALPTVLAMQNEDGSFFQCYDPMTGTAVDDSIKFHFYAYILNALEEAFTITKDDRILNCAVRLADHLAGVFYYRHTVPYCGGNVASPTDQTEADSTMQDSCAGLLWLAKLKGQSVYRDIASKLLIEAMVHQLPVTADDGWAGALLRGVNSSLDGTIAGVPSNRRHLNYDPTLIARCDLWCVVNHIRACRRLLDESCS
ncbi:hypothetical protein QEH59_10155 [Coraliomargarita sp. SDUM461004]|uniref:Glycosyl hydrolase n=1 Tax=Thalassobacterium sedimentorum TaxID=3041258 RepID=A0ABU1AJ64_9BACT|nr:hypothetical protein [Coraliomargarita sp. SDUM461004]MDQ8194789.1 hypothetical protein [Coraliomargarita sp. SDUM461004]